MRGLKLTAALPGVFAQARIVIKLSHVVAQNTPKGKGVLRFKEFAAERTKAA